jgi:hypothetical protein
MAALKLEFVVLRGAAVVVDGKATGLRFGSYAVQQVPTVPFSMRHPSPGCREDRTESPQRIRNRRNGADSAAVRADRPDSLAGVLVRRSPARNQGRAVLLGWPIAAGAALDAAGRSRTGAPTDARTVLPGCPLTLATVPAAGATPLWPRTHQAGKRQQGIDTGPGPVSGTPAISTGGTGD